jgi:hypothetical protein
MQRFDYRAPRFLVDYPVQLTVEDATIAGRCKEISTEGMRLELYEPVAPNSMGMVTMNFESLSVELPARVTHTEPHSAGLKFIYKSERQRKDLERLVTLLTASSNLSGPLSLI